MIVQELLLSFLMFVKNPKNISILNVIIKILKRGMSSTKNKMQHNLSICINVRFSAPKNNFMTIRLFKVSLTVRTHLMKNFKKRAILMRKPIELYLQQSKRNYNQLNVNDNHKRARANLRVSVL